MEKNTVHYVFVFAIVTVIFWMVLFLQSSFNVTEAEKRKYPTLQDGFGTYIITSAGCEGFQSRQGNLTLIETWEEGKIMFPKQKKELDLARKEWCKE